MDAGSVVCAGGAVDSGAGCRGSIPLDAQRLPQLVQPFPHQAIAVYPTTIYAVSELSNALYSWPKGGRKVIEWQIPVRARRGANDSKFEQVVKDPQNAGAIAYDHSVPVAMSIISDDIMALVTYDPVVTRGKFSGLYHLTLLDVGAGKACPDIPIPAPLDPLPHVALEGSRVTVVHQAVIGSDAVTTIRRFKIDASACDWVPMK